jgi:hypothetical protein
MATTKRQRQQTTTKPAAGQPAISTAGQPTISVRAERTAQSLAAERTALVIRRAKVAGAVAIPVVLIAGLLIFFRPFARLSAGDTAQPPAAPAAPAAQAQPTAAPAVQPTAAPAVQPLPTAVPQPAAPQPAAAPTSGAPACDMIAGLPVFANATCVKRDVDSDDGVLKAENTYASVAAADDIRRFYEGAFASGSWALEEFGYEVNLGARRLNVQVETEQGVNGPFTKIKLTERGAAAGARTTCTPIDGLPAYSGAACSDFDIDQDDGVLKVENSYTTSASPEDVRRFYADAFAKNSWVGQDFTYKVMQGQRRLQVEVETQTEAGVAPTKIKVSEK